MKGKWKAVKTSPIACKWECYLQAGTAFATVKLMANSIYAAMFLPCGYFATDVSVLSNFRDIPSSNNHKFTWNTTWDKRHYWGWKIARK